MRLDLKEKILIMGILNVTKDSFYDGGLYFDKDKAIERAITMKEEGADILDIGGESSRPGSTPISIQEEIDRVCPVIEKISREIDIPVSIDTYKSQVALEAIKSGAEIVNDISAMNFDEKMAEVVHSNNVYIVLMHIKGTPQTMQFDPKYENLLDEIYKYLEKAVTKALNSKIARDKIVIDPGIGFGKTVDDNYKIINNIDFFKKLGYPLLIGLSRKSLIAKLYSREYDRLPATIALNSISLMNGADIIRVHDVAPHRLAIKSIEMLKRNFNN